MKRIELILTVLKIPLDLVALFIAAIFLGFRPDFVMFVVALLSTFLSGRYRIEQRFSFGKIVLDALVAASLVYVGLMYTHFIFSLSLPMLVFLGLVVSGLTYEAISQILILSGYWQRRVLIIGAGHFAESIIKKLSPNKLYNVVGVLDNSVAKGKTVAGVSVLGKINELEAVLRDYKIDEVIQTSDLEQVINFVGYAQQYKVLLRVMPELVGFKGEQLKVNDIVGQPLILFHPTPLAGWWLIVKRVFDIAMSLILFIILSPLFILIIIFDALVYRTFLIIIRQKRVDGRNGRIFGLLRFRTLPKGVKENPPANITYGQLSEWIVQHHNNPKAGNFGNFLRRSGLVELPQLFQVVQGKLSLIGPRPPFPFEINQYAKHHHRRLIVKPGMISLGSVSRKGSDFDELYQLDKYYIEHWSLWLDIKVFFLALKKIINI